MGDSFTPPPNTEIPVPPGDDFFQSPVPDFRTIGQQVGAGLKDVGVFGGMLKDLGNTVLKIVAAAIGAVLSLMLCIVSFLIGLINRMYEGAEPGVDAIAKRSLEHVFGVAAGGSTPRNLARGTDTAGAARQLGQTITAAIGAGASASGAGGLQPAAGPSQDFLGKLARIGIEGWTEGMITEALTLGQFKAVMELTPIMAEVLGLGRLSRRVLAPPLKILLEDPYTWFLNDRYRPTLLAHDQACRQFLRGRMTRSDLDRELGRQGFSANAIEALININSRFLSSGDVDDLIAHGNWSQAAGQQHLVDQGYSPEIAATLLAVETRRRTDATFKAIADDAGAAYVRGEIDQGTRDSMLESVGLPDQVRTALELRFNTERMLNVKHLTLGEVETLVKAHIMSLDDLRTWMTRENYPADEQTLIELWLLGKVTSADDAAAKKAAAAEARAKAAADKLAAQQAKAAAAQAALATKGFSTAQFEQLVKLGQRSFAEYQAFLASRGLPLDSITNLVDLLHAEIDKANAAAKAAASIRAAAAVKHVQLAQVEKSVQVGTLTIADLQRFMQQQNFAPTDIKIIVDLDQAQLDAKKAAAAAKATATAAAQEKDISLPQLERAARIGLTTPATYAQALADSGFDAESVSLMTGLLNDQIAQDQTALATRKDAAARAAKQKLSLPQLEQAVLAGARSIDDYRITLSGLGFDPSDISTLVSLLQLRIDNAKSIATSKAAAATKLAAKGLTNAQLERAVKLGVLSIDQYRAELADTGLTADAIDLLATSLLAELAQLQQAAARRATIAKSLAKKGISLAQEEQLVKNGLGSLAGYQAFLIGQGYSAADASNLTALLSIQIDQATAAAAAHQVAVDRAATKSISLSKEEQAVVDGIRTMDDYAALVANLGFDQLDQATLLDLLAQKVAAARAKAAATPPTPISTAPAP
jgi:hypothetical protein